LESSSGNGLAALLRCGTIDLYQTTKLGSVYNYNIVPGTMLVSPIANPTNSHEISGMSKISRPSGS